MKLEVFILMSLGIFLGNLGGHWLLWRSWKNAFMVAALAQGIFLFLGIVANLIIEG